MRVLPCTKPLLDRIEGRSVHGQPDTNVGDWYDAETMALLARVVTTDDGDPVAAMGVVPVLPRVATAWALLSERSIRDHKLLISFVAKRGIRKVVELGIFTRIDMLVKRDFEAGQSWAQWLGFHIEGTKHNYGSDGLTTFDEYVMYLEPVTGMEAEPCNSFRQ